MRYLQAWHALGTILRDGGSWSGHEKNCFFLNTHVGSFADASSIVALDYDSDSRAVAVVDWDHDGDLDLWFSNRTAPRVRYLQNMQENANYLAVRLQGTQSNRDGIGARVELTTMDQGKKRTTIKTLRAGDGFVSQSSKWLHFGLGEETPVSLAVRWPSGVRQTFDQLERNQRYEVVEGQSLQLWSSPDRDVQLADQPLRLPTSDANLRIVPARRVPMPVLMLIDPQGQVARLPTTSDSYRLLTLWATWCEPCLRELKALDAASSKLTQASIDWLPINVDDATSTDVAARLQKADALLSKLGLAQRLRLATQSSVECLDVVQRALVTKQDALPVPSSFLIDKSGRLMAVYKGNVSAEQIVADVQALESPAEDPRDHAVPFPGRWAMYTFPPDPMAIATRLIEIGRMREALDYSVRNIPADDLPPPITVSQLTDAYLEIARALIKSGDARAAEQALQQAIKVDSRSVPARMALGELMLLQRSFASAVEQYRAVLEVNPKQPMTLNNLAWLLASASDAEIRDPNEAIRLAERLCEITGRQEPLSLDTLSVAYAAGGEFDRAVQTVEQAIQLAKRRGMATQRMEVRRQLFLQRQPYVEP